MVLLRERQWQSGLDSTAEMKQRLEHILEVELIEPTGGLQAGLGKILRSRIKNVLTYSIQQLDLCSCHLLRCWKMGSNWGERETREFCVGGIEFEMPISRPGGDVKSAGEYMTPELRSGWRCKFWSH